MGLNKVLPLLHGAKARQHPVDVLGFAIQKSGLSARKFATLLKVDERTVRYWLADQREIPGPVIVLCRLVLHDPGIVHDIALMNEEQK